MGDDSVKVPGSTLGLRGWLSVERFNEIAPGGAQISEDKGEKGRADGDDIVTLPQSAVAQVKRVVPALEAAFGQPRPSDRPSLSTSPEVAWAYLQKRYPALLRGIDENNDGKISHPELEHYNGGKNLGCGGQPRSTLDGAAYDFATVLAKRVTDDADLLALYAAAPKFVDFGLNMLCTNDSKVDSFRSGLRFLDRYRKAIEARTAG